jgi:hypothetical protein
VVVDSPAYTLVGVLWVPFFNRVNPQLWGIPFFFWHQFLWVVISAGVTGFVARMVARTTVTFHYQEASP